MAPTSRSPSPENDVFSLPIIPEPVVKSAGTSSIDLDGLLPAPLLLHEDLKEGCGGQMWPAGIALARYMLSYHRDLRNKSIVEIGAGGGLVGLAVAKGCQTDEDKRIVITDQTPMFSLMQQNIALNNLQDKVAAAVYDWGTPVPAEVCTPAKLSYTNISATSFPDIILAADCVYFEPAFPFLLLALKDLIGPKTVCYFCYKKRRKADLRFITSMMSEFSVEQLEYHNFKEDRSQSIHLYKIRRRDK